MSTDQKYEIRCAANVIEKAVAPMMTAFMRMAVNVDIAPNNETAKKFHAAMTEACDKIDPEHRSTIWALLMDVRDIGTAYCNIEPQIAPERLNIILNAFKRQGMV